MSNRKCPFKKEIKRKAALSLPRAQHLIRWWWEMFRHYFFWLPVLRLKMVKYANTELKCSCCGAVKWSLVVIWISVAVHWKGSRMLSDSFVFIQCSVRFERKNEQEEQLVPRSARMGTRTGSSSQPGRASNGESGTKFNWPEAIKENYFHFLCSVVACIYWQNWRQIHTSNCSISIWCARNLCKH